MLIHFICFDWPCSELIHLESTLIHLDLHWSTSICIDPYLDQAFDPLSICIDPPRSALIHLDLHWSILIHLNLHWSTSICSLIHLNLHWIILIRTASCIDLTLVYIEPSWSTICTDSSCSLLIHLVLHWYRPRCKLILDFQLIFPALHWSTLICIDPPWSALIHLDLQWTILICTDQTWCLLIHLRFSFISPIIFFVALSLWSHRFVWMKNRPWRIECVLFSLLRNN